MPDEIDLAQHAEELFLQANLRQVQERSASRLQPKGSCYSCDARLEPEVKNGEKVHTRIYCDKFCAEDHEALLRAKERSGGR